MSAGRPIFSTGHATANRDLLKLSMSSPSLARRAIVNVWAGKPFCSETSLIAGPLTGAFHLSLMRLPAFKSCSCRGLAGDWANGLF
jgi:hypothetical protein